MKQAQARGFDLEEIKEVLRLREQGHAPAAASPTWPGNTCGNWTRASLDAPDAVTDGNSAVLKVKIPGKDCAACAVSIQNKLRQEAGVITASVNYATEEAAVRYDAARPTPEAISRRSMKPLSARTVRSHIPSGRSARASRKNGTTPRAAPVFPLRSQPRGMNGASAGTASSG